MAYSDIRKRLREGEIVEFEGAKIKMIEGKENGAKLEPGDTYFAERNSGPKLLTVDHVVNQKYAEDHGLAFSGWVQPKELAYSYDFEECVGVEVIFND